MAFGLLPEGFNPQPLDDIRTEIEDDIRNHNGRSLPLGDATFLGHLIGIIAERLSALWEIAEAAVSAMDRDKASGAALEALGLLFATFRIAAAKSTVTMTLCGDDGSPVASGFIGSTASTGVRFASFLDTVLVLLDSWVPAGVYAVGDRVTNSSRCYVCITAGTADGSGGPTTTDDDITDNTAHWQYLGEGTAAIDTVFASVDTGPIVAVSEDLTVIETPVSGVNTIRNLLDAKLGRDVMTDADYRLFQEVELAKQGKGTPDAIRAALLLLTGVTNATVFYNNSDVTDDDGLTPHSTLCLVQNGADQDIWDCLWGNVPVGIATLGDEVGTALDSELVPQAVRFQRPEEIPIYARLSLTKNPKTYDGDATVKAAIVAFGAARQTGDDAVSSAILAQAFRVTGTLDVTNCELSLDGMSWSSATIPVSLFQLAVFDTSRLTITSIDGTP